MKTYVASAVALTALIVGLGGARADALQTLEGFRMTAPVEWPTDPARRGQRRTQSGRS